ncbi:MAG: DUF2334 domain-containing protein [Gammaproteobacteria bacterium]|uniref:DUF2334 domain-containing protein n=1 Tax=OM182 bacterium MED-G24 TaxID=1986255 RepID=A0A2A5WTH5_9GAMM|nr:DUF2334 domain-containing protein [Gammaproteobacteria bacterium]PDH39537.1 MAG: DUF2334 domain-containing protein [OM182 bacterium MED-G24]RPG26540.1 MAG: DUF2334 domain-containing protein [Gammaproteobacteria bacterium TMED50]|tara:strand:+ start:892 stop:1557 length:666 start_codon:yes stop_codon:yes gene_type:complete
MPVTLDHVRDIIDRIPDTCRQNLLLLVVPGLNWQDADIRQLQEWQQEGYLLAGHGWTHEARHIEGLYHRLHSLFISRTAAEHLSLSHDEIIDLIMRNHAWFPQHDLLPPDYYVPPAWALGSVTQDDLRSTPYQYIELTSEIRRISTGQRRVLPLAGFEADQALRKWSLTASNVTNRLISSPLRPLRIAIHPYDFTLLLSQMLGELLERVEETVHYHTLFDG